MLAGPSGIHATSGGGRRYRHRTNPARPATSRLHLPWRAVTIDPCTVPSPVVAAVCTHRAHRWPVSQSNL